MRFMPKARSRAGDILNRSLMIGAIYAVAQALVAMLLGPLSHQQAGPENAILWWFSGSLACLAFAPFVLRSTWSRRDTILAVWAAIAFVRSIGTGIEGALFRPGTTTDAVVGAVSSLAIGLLFSWLVVRLLMPAEPLQPAHASPERTWWGWTWRVLLVGLAYCVFYFGFGAANALLYTLSFYKNNPQYGLNLPPTNIILVAQLIRGPLFGLGALFIVRLADMPRRQTAYWLGLLLFVLGGLGPYIEVVFRSMPLGFNLATLTELFLQNFSTGVVAAFLYKPGTPATK